MSFTYFFALNSIVSRPRADWYTTERALSLGIESSSHCSLSVNSRAAVNYSFMLFRITVSQMRQCSQNFPFCTVAVSPINTVERHTSPITFTIFQRPVTWLLQCWNTQRDKKIYQLKVTRFLNFHSWLSVRWWTWNSHCARTHCPIIYNSQKFANRSKHKARKLNIAKLPNRNVSRKTHQKIYE